MSRMEKSPLLANGYNHPPHLGHMQFMQLPHPAAAHSALLSPAMPHNLARPDGSVIKNQGMPTMEAIARCDLLLPRLFRVDLFNFVFNTCQNSSSIFIAMIIEIQKNVTQQRFVTKNRPFFTKGLPGLSKYLC